MCDRTESSVKATLCKMEQKWKFSVVKARAKCNEAKISCHLLKLSGSVMKITAEKYLTEQVRRSSHRKKPQTVLIDY